MALLSIINFLIVPIVLSLGIISIIILSNFASKKEDFERNLSPLYEAKCGAYISPYNHTWPFVRFSIYKDFIVIKTTKANQINMESIDRVDIADGVFSKGLRILHSQVNLPQSITVWIGDAERVRSILSDNMKIDAN